ncbi:hypothetical protein ABTJ74_20155, partial [Acinetobacter baumannii]
MAPTPNLDSLKAEDEDVRLVHKDWPILTNASLYGARLAWEFGIKAGTTRHHHTLMAIPGARMRSS